MLTLEKTGTFCDGSVEQTFTIATYGEHYLVYVQSVYVSPWTGERQELSVIELPAITPIAYLSDGRIIKAFGW